MLFITSEVIKELSFGKTSSNRKASYSLQLFYLQIILKMEYGVPNYGAFAHDFIGWAELFALCSSVCFIWYRELTLLILFKPFE